MNEMNLGNAYGYSYVKKNPHHIQCQPKKVAVTGKTLNYSKYVADQAKPLNKLVNNIRNGNISSNEALKMFESMIKRFNI